MRPPDWIINCARIEGMNSPCAKSQRGVVLFNQSFEDTRVRLGMNAPEGPAPWTSLARSIVMATGFNGPPEGFSCDGSERCRANCGKLCVHAEQRAILEGCTLDDVGDLDLLHVKVVNGVVVPGGGPSCWQCSRQIVDVGLLGVWLFESEDLDPRIGNWKYYTAHEFHTVTLKNAGLA